MRETLPAFLEGNARPGGGGGRSPLPDVHREQLPPANKVSAWLRRAAHTAHTAHRAHRQPPPDWHRGRCLERERPALPNPRGEGQGQNQHPRGLPGKGGHPSTPQQWEGEPEPPWGRGQIHPAPQPALPAGGGRSQNLTRSQQEAGACLVFCLLAVPLQ